MSPPLVPFHPEQQQSLAKLSNAGDSNKYSHHPKCLGRNFANKSLLSRLNWLHVPLLILTPILALIGLLTWRFDVRTFLFAIGYYFFTGLGITAGYHRLFAHRAFVARLPLRWLLIAMGSGAVEGSIRWWCRDHRAHHKFVDTVRDPYSAAEGFWYAHIGWMFVKQDPNAIGRVDITDLNEDPAIRFQHRHYLLFALAMGFVLPTILCGELWGDYYGGFFIAGVARLVFVHHSTFFVNSLAHFFGESAYSDGHTAKNSVITALLTIGEGYHNFHHEFPSDYRNGVRAYQYDPTKWFIWMAAKLGLAYGLKRFPHNEIHKGMLQMEQKALDAEKSKLRWGPDPATLPKYTMSAVADGVSAGKRLVVLDGFVLDLESFEEDHPGGKAIIAAHIGKDVSTAFRGEVYKHSNAALNLSSMYRVGVISP